MSETTAKSATEIRAELQAVAGALRRVDHLSPEARKALADLVDELSGAMEAGASKNATFLSDSAARLARAIQEKDEPSVLESARRRLEKTVVSAETEAPVLSGIARRLIDALSDIGI